MSVSCESVQKNLSLFVYGELNFEEEEKVQKHLEGCTPCQDELARVNAMHHTLDLAESAVPDGLVVACRRGLRQSLTTAASAPKKPSLLAQLSDWMESVRFLPLGGWKPAGALALIALSFVGGRMSGVRLAGIPAATGEQSVVPTASRVRYVESGAAGNVQIALDETRQRVVSGSLEDPEIRQLLLAAAKDPTDPGLRVESVEVLCSRSQEAEIRDALLFALEHDSNPGVRLKAIAGLKEYSKDPEARQVLARVLLKDTNAGVRAQAIDVLTQERSKDVVGPLQELLRREDNDYVRQRTQRALNEMRASPGVF